MAKKDESYILKKMKEELGTEPWRTQYPSTTISWNLTGDEVSCQKFIGEAKVMLYKLKNRMNLSASLGPLYGLKSFQDIRHYNDGTVIIVKSIYGQDFIEISAGITGFPTCSITLFNVPEVIPPMRWYSDGIHTFDDGSMEVEGVDYIKTYYSFQTKDCNNCGSPSFSICTDAQLTTTFGWGAPQTCLPFRFQDPRRPPVDPPIPVNNVYPDDHCIISGACQANSSDLDRMNRELFSLESLHGVEFIGSIFGLVVTQRSGLAPTKGFHQCRRKGTL